MNFRSKIALAALLLGAVTAAHGQIVPNQPVVTPQGGGEYLYDYKVQVDAGTTVNYNDYFTIYDIYGLTSVETPPTSWTASTPNIGVTPAGAAPPDNAGVPNITWTYTGGPSIVGDPGSGSTDLGDFEFVTTQGNVTSSTQGFYSYDAIESDNDQDQSGVSTVSTPQAPEPASIGLAASAGMLALRRRK